MIGLVHFKIHHRLFSQCACSISHNTQFRTEMYTFLFWVVYRGIWNRCTMGLVRLFYRCVSAVISGYINTNFDILVGELTRQTSRNNVEEEAAVEQERFKHRSKHITTEKVHFESSRKSFSSQSILKYKKSVQQAWPTGRHMRRHNRMKAVKYDVTNHVCKSLSHLHHGDDFGTWYTPRYCNQSDFPWGLTGAETLSCGQSLFLLSW